MIFDQSYLYNFVRLDSQFLRVYAISYTLSYCNLTVTNRNAKFHL